MEGGGTFLGLVLIRGAFRGKGVGWRIGKKIGKSLLGIKYALRIV